MTWAGYGALLVTALSLISFSERAFAKTCRQLEAELTAAGSGGGSVRYQKYDNAVTAQREQIAIARRQARYAGCGFLILGGKSACGVLNDKIGKMERNLAALQRKRAQFATGTPRRNRLRILAELDANGCRGQPRPMARSLPPAEIQPDESAAPLDSDEIVDDVAISSPEGEFRTVCVRTCDGYFFPMSSAFRASDLERDQKNCEAACPGTEMRLYRQGKADEALMSTATGEPYAALPNAFLYKTEGVQRPAGCGCGAIKAPGAAATVSAPTAAEALPTAGQTAGSIVRLGTPSPEEVKEEKPTAPVNPIPQEAPQAEARPMDDRKVRVVGPTFLPAPEAAIDLRAPAPRRDP